MVPFTFRRRSTWVFYLKMLEGLVLETLTELNYLPFGGKHGIGQSCLSANKTTVDIYTSTQISPVYLFLNFCVFFILLLSSDARKPICSAKVEATIFYLQEDNTFSTRGCHIAPIRQTSFNNLS